MVINLHVKKPRDREVAIYPRPREVMVAEICLVAWPAWLQALCKSHGTAKTIGNTLKIKLVWLWELSVWHLGLSRSAGGIVVCPLRKYIFWVACRWACGCTDLLSILFVGSKEAHSSNGLIYWFRYLLKYTWTLVLELQTQEKTMWLGFDQHC